MGLVKSDDQLLQALLEDHQLARGAYKVTPYWQTYNRRIVRELSKSGIGNLQSNYKLLKGFAEGGKPSVITPDNNVKRFVFETLSQLPVFRKVVQENERVLKSYYHRYLDLKIKEAKTRLENIERQFGEIPFSFDLDSGEADDAFDWNGYKVTAKILPYLERACYFYNVTDSEKPSSIMEVGSGLGLSTLSHAIFNENLKTVTNIDIPATLYLSTQFLKSFDVFNVCSYIDFKKDGYPKDSKESTKIQCVSIPPWALEDVSEEHDWFHNAYSFQEMEPAVVKNYLNKTSPLIKKGYWLMSEINGHMIGAGGQRDNVSLGIIESVIPEGFSKENLPESNLEEMLDKVPDTLIFSK